MRFVLIALLSLLSCCAMRSEPTLLSTKASGLDVADAALTAGAPDTALHIAQAVLAIHPDNVPALLRAAQAQTALGQREEAARSFDHILAVAPRNLEAALGLGRLRLATDLEGAATLFKQVIEREPRNITALNDFGISQDLLGHHGEAQQAYRRALAIQPEQTAASVNLGLSLALAGDTQQALRLLRPVAESPATSARVRQNLAVALALSGDDAAANAVLRSDMSQPQIPATLAAYHMLREGS